MHIHKNQIWVLGFALLLSACLGRSRTKIRELNTYPDKYQDQTVTVQGKVVETFELSLLSYRVAKIDDGTGQMWVRPQSRAVAEGEEITLTGQFKTGVTIGRKNFGRMVEEPEPVAPQPAAAKKSAPAPQEASTGEKTGVQLIPYGTFVFNLNYNTSRLQPGSFAVFALSEEDGSAAQFLLSPGNTLLGIDIKGARMDGLALNGKIDFNLRSLAPLKSNNVFAPLFFNIYAEIKTEKIRILAGQASDVISPLLTSTLNEFPMSYLPGNVGYFRPQVRFESYRMLSEKYLLTLQVALAQAITTLQVDGEIEPRQAGTPDLQARAAFGLGAASTRAKAPIELGISGHIGERIAEVALEPTERTFTTSSFNVDLSLKFSPKMKIQGEFYSGKVLGDYGGAIMQTINPLNAAAIRAMGGWAQAAFQPNQKVVFNLGYGRDDLNDDDLATGNRAANTVFFGNAGYNLAPRLTLGLELSWWKTQYLELPAGRAFRVESAILWRF